jgi:inhibitor of KinA sporulation pathway (predicted exonuclease)
VPLTKPTVIAYADLDMTVMNARRMREQIAKSDALRAERVDIAPVLASYFSKTRGRLNSGR